MLFREIIEIETKRGDFIDITKKVTKIVKNCKIQEGLCNIFLPATTTGLIVNENDRVLIEDFKTFFDRIASEDDLYFHPSNAFSHIRASFADNEKTIPISKGELILGTWQSIILWEFDVNNRKRKIIITITGD